jgi:hypothetical protein
VPNLPHDVVAYLGAVRDVVEDSVGYQLAGIYTTGSLALGDFRPNRSDLDLMAVANGPVPSAVIDLLVRRLDHDRLPCPAAGLEFVLYPRHTVAWPVTDAGFLLNLNTGRLLPARASTCAEIGDDFWFAIDRSITHQAGHTLTGPPAQELFAPIPFEHLLPLLISAVRAHLVPGAGHLGDNAVLNACRTLQFAEHRRWLAKLPAARRTLPAAGTFAPLIRSAMTSFEQSRGAGAAVPQDDVTAFLCHVLETLRSLPDDPSRRLPAPRVRADVQHSY